MLALREREQKREQHLVIEHDQNDKDHVKSAWS